jgi:hypothetical protein
MEEIAMHAKLSHAVFAAFAGLAVSTFAAHAQSAPVIPLSQESQSAPPAASGPEAGPVVKLSSPTDSMPGITVSEARTRGIRIQQDVQPSVAVLPRPN